MKEGDVLDGRFRLEARAGSGAMGVVFRAQDLARGHPVAVKVLRQADPTDLARFERETEVLVALQHPSVVRYVAHGRSGHHPFLVMEWLAGETLRDRLERGPLSTVDAIDVGLALASALAGAHARGIVHRDVKPANVFLVGGSARSVRLLDFGIAALRRRQAITEAGALVGTPAYMSPEQARGEEVDARSDVFSLGALLFHALAGERPFGGEDLLSIVLRITRERAPSLVSRGGSTPPELARLVDAMLEPLPLRRPSLGDIASVLSSLRASTAPSHTASHVVPIHAKATLVPLPVGDTLDGVRAQSTASVSGAPTTLAGAGPVLPVAAARVPAIGGVPTSKSRTGAAWKRWLTGAAVVALAGAIAGGVALWASSDGHSPSRGASPAKNKNRGEDAVATVAPPPAPVPASLCGGPGFEVCERLPFELRNVGPDAFLDLCTSVAQRVDRTAELAVATFTLDGDHIDARDENDGGSATCIMARQDKPDLVLSALKGHLVGPKVDFMQPGRTIHAPVPRCPFTTAYAQARDLRPVKVDLNSYAGRYVWTFYDQGSGSVIVDATTCEVDGTNRSPRTRPKSHGDLVWE